MTTQKQIASSCTIPSYFCAVRYHLTFVTITCCLYKHVDVSSGQLQTERVKPAINLERLTDDVAERLSVLEDELLELIEVVTVRLLKKFLKESRRLSVQSARLSKVTKVH